MRNNRDIPDIPRDTPDNRDIPQQDTRPAGIDLPDKPDIRLRDIPDTLDSRRSQDKPEVAEELSWEAVL